MNKRTDTERDASRRAEIAAIVSAVESGDAAAVLAAAKAALAGEHHAVGVARELWARALVLVYPEGRPAWRLDKARRELVGAVGILERDLDPWAADRGLLCILEYKALYLHRRASA